MPPADVPPIDESLVASGDRLDIEDRRSELLQHIMDGPFRTGSRIGGPLHELAAIELTRRGGDHAAVEERFEDALEVLETGDGPVLFVLPGLLRARYRYADDLSEELITRIDAALPTRDYWECCTENHQIMASAAEYLAGALLPNAAFADGEAGAAHRERGADVTERWLDWRARLGFCEWRSNVYYDPDVISLLNLAEFAPAEGLRRRSLAMLDLMLLEFALVEFDGAFATTHGRTDAHMTLNPHNESTRPLAYLLWGAGSLEERVWMSGGAFATSDYRPPALLGEIAADDGPRTVRARHSIDVDEAAAHGLDPTDPDDMMFFWAAHVWNHRDVIETTLEVAPEDHYLRDFAMPAWERFQALEAAGKSTDPDPNKSAMTRANLYDRTTPDWQLSCLQDYRKGRFGFQQHLWQATLSDRAVVYTTHPRTVELKDRPDYWRGNGVMPRVAAHDDVLVSLYRSDPDDVPTIPEGAVDLRRETFCDYTHAFVPRYAFDDLVETGGWVAGRVGDGYLGLYSSGETRWEPLDEEVVGKLAPAGIDDWEPGECDLIADGYENVWVCQLGRRETHGSFEDFLGSLEAATVSGDTGEVTYESPDRGVVEFGWEGPLTVDGEAIRLDGYERLETPYGTVPFGGTTYEFRAGDESLGLSFDRD